MSYCFEKYLIFYVTGKDEFNLLLSLSNILTLQLKKNQINLEKASDNGTIKTNNGFI